MKKIYLFICLVVCSMPAVNLLLAQSPVPSAFASPPMGWNSWDSYGLTITEPQFRENAQIMHDKLLPLGWRYAVIDEGWYFPNPEDRPHPESLRYAIDTNGRLVPSINRYPSSAGVILKKDGQAEIYSRSQGLTELANWMHANGMKLGIHVIRGIPKQSVRLNTPIEGSAFRAQDAADTADACPWDPTSWGVKDNAAGQAWYDSLIRQYSSWGIDFLKVDCIAENPYRTSEIHQIHNAIAKSGREILLSISPGPTELSHASEVSQLSQMWRISNDIWDIWDGKGPFPEPVKAQFAHLALWAPYAKPGAWPDADMLPIGELRPKPDVGPGERTSRLTYAEQQTQMNLWSISRSPLILGANLTMLNKETLALITNKELIWIDQSATASRQEVRDENLVVWIADLPDGSRAVGIFNIGDTVLRVDRPVADLALPKHPKKIRDIWSQHETANNRRFSLQLEPHASAVFLVTY